MLPVGDALVDDVGVQAGQVQPGHGLDQLQQQHRSAARCGRAQVVAQQPAQHAGSLRRCAGMPCSSSGRRSGPAVIGSLVGDLGVAGGEGQQPDDPGRLVRADPQPVGVRFEQSVSGSRISLARALVGPAAIASGLRSSGGPGKPSAISSSTTDSSRRCRTSTAHSAVHGRTGRSRPVGHGVGVDGRELGQRRRLVEGRAQAGVDQLGLVGEDPEDGALADPAGLGDLLGGDRRCRARAATAGWPPRSRPAGRRATSGRPGRLTLIRSALRPTVSGSVRTTLLTCRHLAE